MTLIPNTVISLAKKAKFYNDKYKSYFDFVVNENDTRPSFSTFNDFNGAFLAYFLTISKNTETTHLWNDIKSLKNFKLPETYKGDVYNHIIANIAHTFNYSINLPTYEINKKETKKHLICACYYQNI